MRLYIVRHGETNMNKGKFLQGQTDSELNEYGRELARKTRDGLAEVNFHIAFTSPLKRAKETAQIILGDRETSLVDDLRIQEISFGEYEGLCFGKENYNVPDKDFYNFFEHPEKYIPPKDGESFDAVMERTSDFLKELYENKAYEEKTVLVSTHGCALKAILANIEGIPVKDFWGEGVHPNCAVTIVDVKDGIPSIVEEGKVYYEIKGERYFRP